MLKLPRPYAATRHPEESSTKNPEIRNRVFNKIAAVTAIKATLIRQPRKLLDPSSRAPQDDGCVWSECQGNGWVKKKSEGGDGKEKRVALGPLSTRTRECANARCAASVAAPQACRLFFDGEVYRLKSSYHTAYPCKNQGNGSQHKGFLLLSQGVYAFDRGRKRPSGTALLALPLLCPLLLASRVWTPAAVSRPSAFTRSTPRCGTNIAQQGAAQWGLAETKRITAPMPKNNPLHGTTNIHGVATIFIHILCKIIIEHKKKLFLLYLLHYFIV